METLLRKYLWAIDLLAIADRYLASWNETDAARREALIAALWSPQGRYADPLMSGQGHDGIARMIEAARAQFPGLQFTPPDQLPAPVTPT